MAKIILAAATTLLFLACSSNSNPSSGNQASGNVPSTASTQCEQFVETWCSANVGCAIAQNVILESDRRAQTDACLSAAATSIDCPTIMTVSGSVNLCVEAINATPCSQFASPNGLPMPSSCVGIFHH